MESPTLGIYVSVEKLGGNFVRKAGVKKHSLPQIFLPVHRIGM